MAVDMDSIIMYEPPSRTKTSTSSGRLRRGLNSSLLSDPFSAPASTLSRQDGSSTYVALPPLGSLGGGEIDKNVSADVTPSWNEFDTLFESSAVSKLPDRLDINEDMRQPRKEDPEFYGCRTPRSLSATLPSDGLMRRESSAEFISNHSFHRRTLSAIEIPESRPPSAGSPPDVVSAGPSADDLDVRGPLKHGNNDPIATADPDHGNKHICCDVSVVIPVKRRNFNTVTNHAGARHGRSFRAHRSDRTSSSESPESAAEGDRDKDFHSDSGDGDDGDFSPAADSPYAETPPPSASPPPNSIDGDSTHPRGEAVDSISMSGQLTLYLDGAVPRYTLILSQVARPLADTQVSEDCILDDEEGTCGRRPRSMLRGPRVGLKRDPLTSKEDAQLIDLKDKGLPWKEIARHFPKRRQGTLQARYYTKLRPRTRQRH